MAIALAPDPKPPAPPARFGSTRTLDDAECRAVLARARWGVLAVSTADGPYAVPVGFAVVRDRVYLATGPGLKRDALDHDPRACLTVCDVADGAAWASVVVRGEATVVRRVSEQVRVVAAFAARGGAGGGGSVATTAARLRAARLYSLPLDAMSGRARG